MNVIKILNIACLQKSFSKIVSLSVTLTLQYTMCFLTFYLFSFFKKRNLEQNVWYQWKTIRQFYAILEGGTKRKKKTTFRYNFTTSTDVNMQSPIGKWSYTRTYECHRLLLDKKMGRHLITGCFHFASVYSC